MLKTQRQEQLIRILEKDGIMRISDLATILDSSMMTIRRDLDSLEKTGVVKRIHGGVILSQRTDGLQPTFYERVEEFKDEKDKIGAEAASRINPGDIIFFDAGTTTLAIVKHIPDNLEFTAITNGLLTAVALASKPNINLIEIGGNIHKTSFSVVNYMAVEMIRKFHGNKAFISTKAFDLPYGTFEAQMSLIEVKKAMVESSEEIILLADYSKFNSKSLTHAIKIDDIDEIISNVNLQEDILENLRKLPIKITLV